MSNVDSVIYDLDDLIMFSICPFKYLFKSKGKINSRFILDEKYLIDCALKDTFLYYVTTLSFKKDLTYRQLVSYMSKRLVAYTLIGEDPLPIKPEELTRAIDLVSRFQDIVMGELVAVNFPIERVYINSYTVRSAADMILYSKISNTLEIVFIEHPDFIAHNLFGLQLKACFVSGLIRRDLAGSGMNIVCNILNMRTHKRTEIELNKDHKINYNRFIKSIIKSIEAKAFYPRPSFGACSTCTARSGCDWKVKDE